MEITLESNKYSLEDFLKNKEVRQGIVEMPSINGKFSNVFLLKLEEGKDTTSIFYQYSYNDNFVFNTSNSLYFLLSIDYKNKIVIHDELYMGKELEKELEFLKDEYQTWHKKELSVKAKNEYKDTLLKKIQGNLTEMEKDEKFIKVYNKILKDYSFTITNDYLKNPNMENYELYIRRLNWNGFLEEDNLEQLRDYLTNPLLIEELVEKYYEEDAKIVDIAEIEAKNFILENLRNNPDEYVKLSLKIREAIREGGKTLNIETKDGVVVKVESRFNGREFRTVTGWNRIEIENIEKITFNRKVLFAV